MKNIIYILFLFSVAACSTQKEKVTDKFERGKQLAEVNNKNLKEVSGLATSISNPGMLWAHNDSGNGPQVFLIDEETNIKLTCRLAGVKNRDWEDITVGSGPDTSKNYVYVGDIGDNDAEYQYKHIYRFEEPEYQSGVNELTISDFDTITFELSDKKKDTESLMIDPDTKNLYLVSKRENPVYVYELKYPYAPGNPLTASRMVSLPFAQIVAADVSSSRGDVLMKNYGHIYYWENTGGDDLITLLKKQPLEVPYEQEPQGESITWARDGSGFYTLSEKSGKQQPYLYFYALKK